MIIDANMGGREYDGYDADRVSFQGLDRKCTGCGQRKPIQKFGLRVVRQTLRVQPQCKRCRGEN